MFHRWLFSAPGCRIPSENTDSGVNPLTPPLFPLVCCVWFTCVPVIPEYEYDYEDGEEYDYGSDNDEEAADELIEIENAFYEGDGEISSPEQTHLNVDKEEGRERELAREGRRFQTKKCV